MQGKGKLTVFPNPNAPTGIALPLDQVEAIVAANPDHVVVVDEAYVDFGADSAVPLLQKYDNLLVVMTYSKSRSMAGARLSFALGSRGLIEDLEKLKYSTNPYNVNRLTLKLGAAAVDSDGYFREKAREIMATRERTAQALRALGFTLPDSQANFLFVTHPKVAGGDPVPQVQGEGGPDPPLFRPRHRLLQPGDHRHPGGDGGLPGGGPNHSGRGGSLNAPSPSHPENRGDRHHPSR